MKPFIRKSWYTLSEAADYLTRTTESGTVTVSDILQLAADFEISLSIHFSTKTWAQTGRIELSPLELYGHPSPENLVNELVFPASIPTKEVQDTSQVHFIDEIYNFVEFDYRTQASPGTFWTITPHGGGIELLAELWRESFETAHDALNKPASLAFLKDKHVDPDATLEPTNQADTENVSYDLFLVDNEDKGSAPPVIRISWENLPDDTLFGVTRDELDSLITDGVPETDPEPATHELTMPLTYQELYDAVGTGAFPHIDYLITAWARYWKGRSPNDGKPYPKNSQVVDWVKEQMDNPRQASNKATAIASIIRPTWAPNHRQANRDA